MERILTGIQPSGLLTIGNYIGSIKQMVALQDEYESFMFIANMHSITVEQNKKELVKNTIDLVSLYLACGIDPAKTTIFLQSDVLEHNQLGWILQCQTYMGELSRMTQYKDKSSKQENIGSGLFSYPALMAADILLYDPKYIPVGEDQRQHLELTRDLANRFNNKYNDAFIVPEPLISKTGAKIMSLSDPTRKMSKSDPAGNKACLYLLDDANVIMKKIKSATTDSIGIINYDVEKQPGISNLLTIYAILEDIKISDALEIFKDSNYGDFKVKVAECIIKHFSDIQANYHNIISNKEYLKVLDEGASKASFIAKKKMNKIKNKMGLNIIRK